MAEILVTASIGLFKCKTKYYMQIITAEEYNFYFVEITAMDSFAISVSENIEVEECDQLSGGMVIQRV